MMGFSKAFSNPENFVVKSEINHNKSYSYFKLIRPLERFGTIGKEVGTEIKTFQYKLFTFPLRDLTFS